MKNLKEYFKENEPSLELHFELMETYFNNMTVDNYQKVIYCGMLLYNLKSYKPTLTKSKSEPKTKDFTFLKFIEMFNDITGRNFKGDSKSERQFNARCHLYSKKDFENVITNANNNLGDYIKYLTPEYITRQTKFENWFNYTDSKKDSDF